MNTRHFWADNSASTPIEEKVSLPNIALSEIGSIPPSHRYHERRPKNRNSSSSSDQRDTRKALLSGNATKKSSRCPGISGTTDELGRAKRNRTFSSPTNQPDRQVEERTDISSSMPIIDSDDARTVGEHAKIYPGVRPNIARNNNWYPRATRRQPEKRHVRNRELMTEIRNRFKAKVKTSGRSEPMGPRKKSSPCETMHTYGSLAKVSRKIYDNIVSSFEESDEEYFVVNGVKLLRNPPRSKFFRPSKAPERKIDPKTGELILIPCVDEDLRVVRSRWENEKSAPFDVNAKANELWDRVVRTIGADSEAAAKNVETARRAEKSATRTNFESPVVISSDSSDDERSKGTTGRSYETVRPKTRSRKIGKSRSKIPSTRRDRTRISENETTIDNDSSLFNWITDRRRKKAYSTRLRAAKKRRLPTDVEVSPKKKYRRINTLICSDSDSSPKVSATMADVGCTIEKFRPSVSKIEESVGCESDDTVIIDRENTGECSIIGESVSAKNVPETIPPSTLTKSSRNTHNDRPKIVSTKILHNRIVERRSTDRWRINVTSDFDDR